MLYGEYPRIGGSGTNGPARRVGDEILVGAKWRRHPARRRGTMRCSRATGPLDAVDGGAALDLRAAGNLAGRGLAAS